VSSKLGKQLKLHDPRIRNVTSQGGEETTVMNKSNGHSAMSLLPKLLTETQVSMLFNVSINTLRYWRHCGDGPNYIKMGKLVRYHEAELESYVQRKTCVSKARATAEERHVAH
jgi:predicted DNA-binding transcriptional regulator AlpA